MVVAPDAVLHACLESNLSKHPKLWFCKGVLRVAHAWHALTIHQPAVVVADTVMPGGLNLVRDLEKWAPECRAVAYQTLGNMGAVERAFRAGARGVIAREDPVTALIAGISAVAMGGSFLGPAVMKQVTSAMGSGCLKVRDPDAELLSPREREVFHLFGEGCGPTEISGRLGVKVKTVETLTARMKLKLLCHSTAELRARAVLERDHDLETSAMWVSP
jgi:DNA-binding NarL/FixJ family response regulator